jgi:hypothetical protein
MSEESRDRQGEAPSGEEAHQEFLELCAIAASQPLSPEERKRLDEHLTGCAECRKAQKEFEGVVDRVIPRLAAEQAPDPPLDASFSQESAEASFQKRLAEEKERERMNPDGDAWLSPLVVRRSRNVRSRFDRYHLWLPMIAGVLLCIALGAFSFRAGENKGIEWARNEERTVLRPQRNSQSGEEAIRAGVSYASRELAAREEVIAALRREVSQQGKDLENLKSLLTAREGSIQTTANDKTQLAAERDRLLQQVSAQEIALRETESRLKTLESERSEHLLRAATLETKISDLSPSLREQPPLTDEQKELLNKYRDLRELIASRDLYITDVYDVAGNGETQKAFGRLFCTKGKSLLFYAYDLDETPRVQGATTFQAWGRRGPDWSQAAKLGVFYEDNVLKKRWILKSNDKKTLDQIDAVFVTVEPKGGSERPTGKPFLIAYLKVAANHP